MCLRHLRLGAAPAAGDTFFASPKKVPKKGDPRLRPSGLPSVGREPNDKAVCLSPLSRRWATGGLKPQTQERGTALVVGFF